MNVLGPGPMLELWNILDFSVQIVEESYIFLISFPEEESRLNAIIRPYTLMVMYISYILCLLLHNRHIYMHAQTWILILISTLAFVGFVTVKPYISYQYWNDRTAAPNNRDDRIRRYSPARTYGKVSMYVMAVFTNHGKVFFPNLKIFSEV